ncbi:hypothetical protein DPMN_156672 [Dreissena polymorpha]|uniref:Uncharacterized protein n=1 Tax=Dreissena polymorpha TaxID=45954 RepID=A0A9D4FPE0_DREPO|nr:hypothetical protein DPMN_156672 [Dreissena polymorpha]
MDLIQRPAPFSCAIEGANVMASARMTGSIPEPGSLADESKWGEDKESAPGVPEWISARNEELTTFDSHFHLDSICKVTKASSIDALVGHYMGPIPQVPVRVNGWISVFCDPLNYPREYPCVTGFRSAVGVHHKAPPRDVKEEGQVDRELRKDVVVALGEIGLDLSLCLREWCRQKEMFEGMLELACPRRPVILHIPGRGNYTSKARALALRLMWKTLVPHREYICTVLQ